MEIFFSCSLRFPEPRIWLAGYGYLLANISGGRLNVSEFTACKARNKPVYPVSSPGLWTVCQLPNQHCPIAIFGSPRCNNPCRMAEYNLTNLSALWRGIQTQNPLIRQNRKTSLYVHGMTMMFKKISGNSLDLDSLKVLNKFLSLWFFSTFSTISLLVSVREI